MSNTIPAAGTIARFDQEDGDQYIGTVSEVHGCYVTIADYSVWYEGDSEPHNSIYPDDTVRFLVTRKTVISQF
jgi:hypothetical protein